MTPWPSMPIRRASVNSFGYGGANAHCILEHVNSVLPGYQLGGQKMDFSAVKGRHHPSANLLTGNTNGYSVTEVAAHPRTNGLIGRTNRSTDLDGHILSRNPIQLVNTPNAGTRRLVLLPISGHDKHSLKANISATAGIVADYHLADLAYTLSSRRSRYFHRGYALVNANTPEKFLDIDAVICGKSPSSQVQRIGFVFTGNQQFMILRKIVGWLNFRCSTGQGAQWGGMGAGLFHQFEVFRNSIRFQDAVLKRLSKGPKWTIEGKVLS